MIRKLTLALLLTLPTMAVAIDLEGLYITPKGGISKSMDTGLTYSDAGGGRFTLKDNDLGTGDVFGLSVGKYTTNNFRLELEASQRGGLKYDTQIINGPSIGSKYKADIKTQSIFINGFYDFESFAISSSSVTPYVGGGIGRSKNKMGRMTSTSVQNPNITSSIDGNKVSQFAYKLAAGALISLTKKLSLDINYQYVDLGSFKSGVNVVTTDGVQNVYVTLAEPNNGGEIKTHELMVGLQYKF